MNAGQPITHIEGGIALDLAELTQYQAGSIVSRTLLQADSGTLTVFSFDAGQALSEHTVPYNAFIQVLDGEAELPSAALRSLSRPAKSFSCPAASPTRCGR